MKIEVTEDDIKNGKKNNLENCPIFLVLKRMNLKNLYVTANYIGLMDSTGDKISLPESATRFIYDFDNGKDVKNFEFEINYFPK